MNSETRSPLHPLEKRLYGALKDDPKGTYLLAISGGLDSLVLLNLLSKLQGRLKWELLVGHVHHGLTGDEETDSFRNESQTRVQELCQKQGLPFLTNEAGSALGDSEEELRNFRWSYFKNWVEESQAIAVVTAHHFNDMIETRFMNLIRGSGEKGLLAMERFSEAGVFRPLLECTRDEIEKYAAEMKIEHREDPSNKNLSYLRNWVRNKLFVDLEERNPGSILNMGRSFEQIAQSISEQNSQWLESLSENASVPWSNFLVFDPHQQSQAIAELFRRAGCHQFSRTHVNEVLKRLDSGPKDHTFKVKGMEWIVSESSIEVRVD